MTCASGALSSEIPPHGTLGRNRQQIPADKFVGAPDPDDVSEGPAWVPVPSPANARKTSHEHCDHPRLHTRFLRR